MSAEGIDPAPVLEIAARIHKIDDTPDLYSMLIVRNGKLVFEAYSPYVQRNSLYWLASVKQPRYTYGVLEPDTAVSMVDLSFPAGEGTVVEAEDMDMARAQRISERRGDHIYLGTVGTLTTPIEVRKDGRAAAQALPQRERPEPFPRFFDRTMRYSPALSATSRPCHTIR